MNRTFAFAAAVAAAATLCSCGHNVTQYGKGLGFDIGINPETYMVSVTFRYGEMISAVVKEKTTVEYTGEMKTVTTTGAEGTKAITTETGTGAKFRMTTGDQVTGYVVDLEKAKQEKK